MKTFIFFDRHIALPSRATLNINASGLARATLLLPFLLLLGCETTPPSVQGGPDAELSYDGLHKVNNSQADLAWIRPGFDISGYSKIMLQNAGIEYRPVQDRGRSPMVRSNAGPYFIDEKSRAEFEALVSRIFKEEMQKVQEFEIVDAPGPDVLLVRGALLDVVSMVPPDPVGGRSYVILSSVGEATLVLELRDSESDAILARSADRRAAENLSGIGNRSNSVSNSAEVTRLIRFWATRLRESLDGFAQRSEPVTSE